MLQRKCGHRGGSNSDRTEGKKACLPVGRPGLLKDPEDPHPALQPPRASGRTSQGAKGDRKRHASQGKQAVDALNAGVNRVHFIDGRLPHSILLEIFTDEGIGTEIVHD